jgi:hypothetical protein
MKEQPFVVAVHAPLPLRLQEPAAVHEQLVPVHLPGAAEPEPDEPPQAMTRPRRKTTAEKRAMKTPCSCLSRDVLFQLPTPPQVPNVEGRSQSPTLVFEQGALVGHPDWAGGAEGSQSCASPATLHDETHWATNWLAPLGS